MPLDPNRLLERAFASCAAMELDALPEDATEEEIYERGQALGDALLALSAGFCRTIKENEDALYRAERKMNPLRIPLT